MSSLLVGEAGTFGGKVEDAELADWLERADHPLLNDLILKAVFVHVRRCDLKSCRVVCKKWNEHTIPLIRPTCQVTIHGNRSEEQNTESRRIVDFVKLFKSNELGLPFEKCRFSPIRTTDGAGKQFLQIFGKSIKELVLFQPKNVDYVRTIDSVSEILKFSPNLESLTISGQFVSRYGNVVKLFPHSKPVSSAWKHFTVTPVLSSLKSLIVFHDRRKPPIKYCPTFYDELLSVASNISHIYIDDAGYERSGITLVLNSIEKLGMKSSIQSLVLKSASVEHVEILKRMAEKPNGLKLKRIGFRPEKTDSTVRIQLATTFKDTLEYYNLSDGSQGTDLMEFPKMPKLKSFILGVRQSLSHKPVILNHKFPVSETLNIEFLYVDYGSDERNDSMEFFSQFQVCPTVKIFILAYNVTGIRTFRNILSVFPNLRKLTLRLRGEEGEQVLRQIWATMTQLESLSLEVIIRSNNPIKLDSLFTGIPIEELNKIHRVIPDLEKMTVQERNVKIWNLLEEHKTQKPSIRNLTDLRRLKLELRLGWRKIDILSDLTGYLGIYLMKRLKHLDIKNCNFTKTCCEILTMDIRLEAWSFQTEDYTAVVESKHIIPPFPIPDRD